MSESSPFQTTAKLPDGTELRIAAIQPEDAPLLLEGMQRLSSLSRRQRFHGPKQGLNPRELDHLVHCDGINHIGIGAGFGDPVEPVAVARCFRDDDEPHLAEVAIVVVDDWQGRGVGSVMMRLLAEQALAAGISGFKGTFMADNLGIQKLIDGLGAEASSHEESLGLVEAVFPIRENLQK